MLGSLRRLNGMVLIVGFSVVTLGLYDAFQTHDAEAMGSPHRFVSKTSREYDTIVSIRTESGNCPHCGGSITKTYHTRRYKIYKVKILQVKSHGEWVDVAEVERRFWKYDFSESGPAWACLNANCGG